VPNHVGMINAIYPYLVLNIYYVAITEDKITMLTKFRSINTGIVYLLSIVFIILVAFTSMLISIGRSFAIDRRILS
jgi:hypothetical protein